MSDSTPSVVTGIVPCPPGLSSCKVLRSQEPPLPVALLPHEGRTHASRLPAPHHQRGQGANHRPNADLRMVSRLRGQRAHLEYPGSPIVRTSPFPGSRLRPRGANRGNPIQSSTSHVLTLRTKMLRSTRRMSLAYKKSTLFQSYRNESGPMTRHGHLGSGSPRVGRIRTRSAGSVVTRRSKLRPPVPDGPAGTTIGLLPTRVPGALRTLVLAPT